MAQSHFSGKMPIPMKTLTNPDDGLVEEYGTKNGGNGSGGGRIVIPPPVSKIDKKTMGT
jgi:hypothetical protein